MNANDGQLTPASIPIVDFSKFLSNSSTHRQQTIEEIFQACHNVGFLYLSNHGIPTSVIEQAFEQSRIFFELPLAQKQQIAWSSEHSNCGYIGIERERLNEAQPGDLKEAFNITKENLLETNGYPPDATLWPSGYPLFRQTIADFFELCSATAAHIFQAFASALSLPESYFVERHQTQDYTLRLLNYPSLNRLPKSGQLRAGAHSDYGSLTLLFQNSIGGLEVRNTQVNWIAAPAIPDTILINIGDLMERWSNDVFQSTRHRVRLPDLKQKQQNRYSIAFFCQPDAEVDIVCLPTCQSKTNPAKYPSVKSGDYLLSRLQATY
ncbi:MAG: isopenicillin N synthase family dioxygenase [Leptolyngbyaceae cyanobacterium]